MGFDAPEPPEPPPPPPPPSEIPSLSEKFEEAAERPAEEVKPIEEQADAGDFRIPRAANDDVAGTDYERSDGIPVIGRLEDTSVAHDWEGHTVIDLSPNPNANEVWAEAHDNGELRPDGRPVTEPGWSPELNQDWVDAIIDSGSIVYLGSEPSGGNLVSGDGQHASVFADEVGRIEEGDYERVGDYLVPTGLSEAFGEAAKKDGDGTEKPELKLDLEHGGGGSDPAREEAEADEQAAATKQAEEADGAAKDLDSQASNREAEAAGAEARGDTEAAKEAREEAAALRLQSSLLRPKM